MRCRRSPYVFVLHGPITGSGAATITIKCPGCRKKNIFTAAQLREIARLGRQAQRVQKADQRAKVARRPRSDSMQRYARSKRTISLRTSKRIRVLDGLLSATLDVDDYIEFESLKEEMVALPFAAGELGKEEPKPRPEAFLPPKPGAVGRLFGVRKYEEQKKKGMLAHEQP
jgi:phage FluMu protein Com